MSGPAGFLVDTFAHGLWAAAAAVTARRVRPNLPVRWIVWWAVFPDVLAFGPSVVLGLWLRFAGGAGQVGTFHGGHVPRAHIGLPLYNIGHSLVVFAAVFTLAAILAPRFAVGLSGWLLHILIDIPTHSFSYYATRFLWPLSGYRFDGIAWWTPWFFGATYAALAVTYLLLWKAGWLTRRRPASR